MTDSAWKVMREYEETLATDVGRFTFMNKFGYATGVGTTEQDIWDGGGTYVFATVGGVRTVAGGPADAQSTGTGAHTVQIYGLATDYTEQNETITLTGTTAVTTTGKYIRNFRAVVRSAGAAQVNVGNIDISTTGGVLQARVMANEGQTLMAIYTVPDDYQYALLRSFLYTYGRVNSRGTFRLQVRPQGEAWQTKDKVNLSETGTSIAEFHDEQAEQIPAKADIRIRVVSAGINAAAAGHFHLLQVRK